MLSFCVALEDLGEEGGAGFGVFDAGFEEKLFFAGANAVLEVAGVGELVSDADVEGAEIAFECGVLCGVEEVWGEVVVVRMRDEIHEDVVGWRRDLEFQEIGSLAERAGLSFVFEILCEAGVAEDVTTRADENGVTLVWGEVGVADAAVPGVGVGEFGFCKLESGDNVLPSGVVIFGGRALVSGQGHFLRRVIFRRT